MTTKQGIKKMNPMLSSEEALARWGMKGYSKKDHYRRRAVCYLVGAVRLLPLFLLAIWLMNLFTAYKLLK